MAGVRPQPGSAGGYQIPIVWFVGAVVLWIVSTVFLVVLYTDQTKIKEDKARIVAQNQRLVSSGELQILDRFANRPGNRSLVGVLESERAATTALLTGDEGMDFPAAAKSVGDALMRIVNEGRVESAGDYRNASAVQAIGNLYGAFSGQQDESRRLAAANQSLRRENDELRDSLSRERSGLHSKADELAEQVVQLQRDYEQFRIEKDKQVSDLVRDSNQLREQTSEAEREHAQELAKLETRGERLLTMMKRLREQLSKLSPEADPEVLLRQADGEIVEVNMSAGLAYINLGSTDRLKRGMTFAVYPADGRLPESGQGKGTLEVMRVYPETAECRIRASVPGDPILPGEYVGNVVFDRKRSFRFRVTGRFDLDFDGAFDSDGSETIEAMIAEWGGTVVDGIDERTDFVVIGGAPPGPRALSATPTSAEQALVDQAVAAVSEFDSIRREAQALSIPLLTQTQFLNLIGFEYTFDLAVGF